MLQWFRHNKGNTARDVSETHQVAEALREKTKALERSNSDLRQFTRTVSHDMQEPLRTIEGFSNRLMENLGDKMGATEKDYLERIQKNVRRMTQLIDDLLVYSGVTARERPTEAVNVAETIRETISDLERQIRESGGVVEVGKIPSVRADKVQIRQLFQNLISNALKFRDPKRPPRVSVEGEDTSDGFVKIAVRDNGIGFEQKYAVQIFEPFHRLHARGDYPGTGLGLAVCQKIVERCGGRIEAEGSPGKGAVFTVFLPPVIPSGSASS